MGLTSTLPWDHDLRDAMERAKREGQVATARELVFVTLRDRFEWVPPDIRDAVEAVEDLTWLRALFLVAVTVRTLAEFERELAEELPES